MNYSFELLLHNICVYSWIPSYFWCIDILSLHALPVHHPLYQLNYRLLIYKYTGVELVLYVLEWC